MRERNTGKSMKTFLSNYISSSAFYDMFFIKFVQSSKSACIGFSYEDEIAL
jgi:hypothetical protein